MSYPPQIDPYAVLGVSNNVSLPEIKAAHRKLVLKYHPDKVKDESLRNKAQDEFQKVQQAYELLSDGSARAKYDQDARLANLKKDSRDREFGATPTSSFSWSTPRTTAREFRDGHFCEVRFPSGFYFDDADDVDSTEEPHQTSRKYNDFPKRQPRPKGATATAAGMDEKRRSRTYPSPAGSYTASAAGYGGAAKKSAHSNNVKASFDDIERLHARKLAKEYARQREKELSKERAKERAKERKRETLEKMRASYVEPDDSVSDSDASSAYENIKRPSESRRSHPESPRYRETTSPSSRRTKVESFHRHSLFPEFLAEDEVVAVEYDKHDRLHTTARNYIRRSKGTTTTATTTATGSIPDRHARVRTRASQSSPDQAGEEPESHTHPSSRRTGSTEQYTRSRDRVRNPYDHAEPQFEREIPQFKRAATESHAGSRATSPPPPPSLPRASTAPHIRLRRDRPSRLDSVLHNMAHTHVGPVPPRTPKMRTNLDRPESGYSSPNTPDMSAGLGSPKPSSARYATFESDTILDDFPDRPSPSSSKIRWTYEPERPRMSVRSESKPSRSATSHAYPPGTSIRYGSPRSNAKLFGEFDLPKSPRNKDRYARDFVDLDDDSYFRPYLNHHNFPPPLGRRTTAS